MNCERCEELLLERAEGALENRQLETLETHLEDCPACAGLAVLIESDLEGELVVPSELTSAVLSRTSGSDRIGAALRQLDRDLPALASMETDERFVADVMEATVIADRDRLGNRVRRALSEFWERAIQRPRLALESGYVAALVMLLVFGLPGAPLADVPGRALERLRADDGPVRFVTASVERAGELGRQSWQRAGDLVTYGGDETGRDRLRDAIRGSWLFERLSDFFASIREAILAGWSWITSPWHEPGEPSDTTDNAPYIQRERNHDRIHDHV